MKKFLSVLAALAISATGVSNVIACGNSSPTEECEPDDSTQEKKTLQYLLDTAQTAIDQVDPEIRDYVKNEINELIKDINLGRIYLANGASSADIHELVKKIIHDHKLLLVKINQYSVNKNKEIIAELEKKKAEFDALQAEYDRKVGELLEIQEENARLKKELDDTIANLIKIEAELKTVQEALEAANGENAALKEQLKAAIEAKDQAIKDLEQAQADLKDLEALLAQKNDEIAELNEQLEQIKGKIEPIKILHLEFGTLYLQLSNAIDKALIADWAFIPPAKPEIFLVLLTEVQPALLALLAKINEISTALGEI